MKKLLAVALLLSGCVAQAPASNPPTTPALLNPPTFNACTAGFSSFTWGGDFGPGTVPPEWNRSAGVGSAVKVEVLQCSKISWDQYERPVSLVLELHSKGEWPQKCMDADVDFLYFVERILVSDSDLANYLAQEYNLPAEKANISLVTRNVGEAVIYDWKWRTEGNDESLLRFENTPFDNSSSTSTERLIWMDGHGLDALDLKRTYTGGLEPLFATGTMAAPMLYSQAMPTTTYVGVANVGTTYHATSTLTRYGDEQCESSLPS
ncbi:MAG TPA: hypothetical protein VM286_01350 [Candidatus Thermoplasmatota archaeon]|nr:hypothetical protein [Candidatus Thermoplasmatota archaeon]